VARHALGVGGGWPKASAVWAATFSRTRSAIRSTSYPLARVRISVSAAHSHSMALSKAVTLLDRSRRKLRISVVMLMMPPTQECFVPLGQNHQWDFRTMLAVLRCEFLRERAGAVARGGDLRRRDASQVSRDRFGDSVLIDVATYAVIGLEPIQKSSLSSA